MFIKKIKNQYLEVRTSHLEVGLSSKGFSIIELIVVISIIGLMSTVMFANYRQGERNTALEYTAQEMAQDIRKAQNLSLAGAQLNGEFTYGYGIHFDKNNRTEYFIYGDVGAQNKNENIPVYQYHNKEDEKIIPNPIVLPSNIEIKDMDVDIDIFFAPPDPVTYINGVFTAGTKIEIKICFITDNTKCKTIKVTTAGRVEVN
ncbi:hypothetical protein CVV26_01970 [Candidatus Kuenenbacteria bacterium HGW-Kuenenbacteria-1]|uniref:General secretion pathway GspH domain-containing protein n=1 Tax=Candidatus Kuenenbacteria bacterium HGW-Kuenenbacteria-1 TaxID=2013812 RepID=A0A2N1UNK3_9BACT|nr:MAG: hypothetical protein CVV26_01970 [Candidatus Kuenenbacteria bacterium HGW-Kuenenbacteria-1]